jgi:transcriptional regulator with XRE-family HTH domain
MEWNVSGVPTQVAPDPALAAVLRSLRIERGITQESLAYRSGITTGSLARIELGQASPAWTTVCRIVAALGVSLVDLAAAVEEEIGARFDQREAVKGASGGSRRR